MNAITRDELQMALTKYYQDFQDQPEEFTLKYGTPADDAKLVTEVIFNTVKLSHAR